MLLAATATATALPVCVVGSYLLPHTLRLLEEKRLREACARTRTLVLSYDDGPGRVLTAEVLAILAAHAARASFFLVGTNAVGNELLIERLVREGHEVGCHGYGHLNAWRHGPGRVTADINRGYQSLSRWIGPAAPFRPPYGKTCLASRLVLRRRGAPIAWWTVDSGDTAAELPDSSAIIDRVRRFGGVVLMHDFDRKDTERSAFVLSITEKLLKCARQEGLTVRRIRDLPAVAPREVSRRCA